MKVNGKIDNIIFMTTLSLGRLAIPVLQGYDLVGAKNKNKKFNFLC